MAERKVKLNPNQVLFKEGAVGKHGYVLKQGKIEISVMPGDDKIVLAVLTPTVVFGEMAVLFFDNKRTATATALEYSELVEIHKDDFNAYLKKTPNIIVHILDALVRRLRKTTEMVGTKPETFLAICEILNLMAVHKNETIHYKHTVNSIS
ncbi:MAG: cyclic nucleotide-binding domain-containing protein, partial [Thermodesulfobacteriota bacterium]